MRTMPLDLPSLAQVVAEMAGRPGHEKTRTNVWKLLTDGLDILSADIDFEKRLVHGRMDALIGTPSSSLSATYDWYLSRPTLRHS